MGMVLYQSPQIHKDAIKSRFGGNDESKKMQKYMLKQKFEGFSISNSEGLHKGYDRFQSLLSQLEIHGAGVSTEDANQKFLRSLPSVWSQVSLIMRTKPKVDSLSFDDLYNNLKVFENDVKGSTASSSNTQNYEQTSSYSLLANQSSCPQLDHEDLEQLDEFDLEEIDLEWQVAMISMRMKKFYKKTGRKLQFDAKEPVGFDKTKVECYNYHKTGHFARKCKTKGNQDSRKRDAWNSVNKDRRGSGSDTEVNSCSNECKESYAKLKKLYDAQREQLSDANIEIKAYTQGLKKVEAVEAQYICSTTRTTLSEIENQPLYDRFVTAEGMHAVPPPMTVSKSRCQKSLNVESQPKVWSDAPIIEEYESDSEDECVVIPTKQKVTPSFAKQQVKTPRENVKKEMARKAELNNGWNNVQRVNKQNQFVPSAVLTRTGIIPVNTARTSGKLLLIPHQVVIGDHKDTMVDPNTMVDPVLEIDYPHRALKNKGIVDSGCSRHMTGNKAYLAEFQDFNGGPVAFGGIEGFNIIDEGFLVGYSLQSKAFRVYNLETKRVEENLHINFLENKPNIAGKGPTWLFDLDYLTDSMNYHPVRSENQANHLAGQQEANQNAGTEDIIDAGDSETEDESAQDCFVLPIWPSYSSTITPDLKTDEKRDGPREEEQVFMDELERLKRQEKEANEEAESLRKKFETLVIQEGAARPSSTNIFSTVSTPAKASSTNLVNTVSIPVSTASPHEGLSLSDPTNPEEDDSEIPPLEDIYQNSTDGIFTTSSYDDEGAVADFTNLETVVNVSPIPTSRIHSTHPKALILGDPNSAVQTRSKLHKSSGAHAFVSYVQKQRRNNHKDFQHCLFACFLSQHEPKKISEALEEKAWLSVQSGFIEIRRMKEELLSETKQVYQMDVKSAFLYGKIDEELPEPGMQLLSTFLLKNSYRRDAISQDRKLNDVVITISIGHSKVSHLSASREFLSDYAGANLDRKSTTELSRFLGRRLISWQCKKQTIVATSTTEAEYVAAASCCGQVLWIQNQMLDYGFNFMNTKIYIDNESTICIVKNPVYHSKTKHIAIRHHFIRDAYEKKLIQVLKIHTDDNVADLLTKAFDVSQF
ncbi:ribonuclease H-like domain-containing protein [Tanacetum coccineum]